MLPLRVTSPLPLSSSSPSPLISVLAVVPVFSTSITVDVSLYFAERPLSAHSKTWSESQLPLGMDAWPSCASCGAKTGRQSTHPLIAHRTRRTLLEHHGAGKGKFLAAG